ncbi:uncharacterized protein LOC130276163 isoform X1 [Hyla sarda]|uniref:uncharacterized protein LOC130276163 isoform X1 n=1 Tax=Hyla sarda TaxID=327740 RepID=UPI0024C276FD|nr:uncharacterized protein LOC130276163 isoform X1 [Hyla sarda]XP_056381125.1 uncharacterized protein LOC130276163 isoform X1 [Hyla sarda]XP_056381134.1 uncharacterized protein LOC130276163 isoform X1 [Hyla sarda]XP_056381143.1 uncharacterized protein LOC130276163 isoform X1 [Hyla sarda]
MTSDSPDLHDAPYHVAMEAGDSDVLEIERWCCRLRQENTDLQDALGKADVEIHKLSQEIALLREKNKNLQKEICQFVDLKEQVENLKFKVKQNKDAADMESQPKEDKIRCLQKISTIERADQLVNQLDCCHDETVVLKKEVNRLRNQTTNLEKELQKRRLDIKKKQEFAEEKESIRTCMTITLNEYASTREALNNKICTLQSQVEESSQDNFLRRTIQESSKITEYPPDDGTLMYEILQAKLDEERLRWTDEQKKWGFLRLLYTMMLKVLWCNFKVAFFFGFFVLLFHYLLQLAQSQDQRWYIQSVFSSETIEWMEHICQSFLQLITLGEMPHKSTF